MKTAWSECSKKQNKGRDLVESVKKLQHAGLQVQGGFIVGFDSDPLSIFQQQIDFIQKSGIVTAMVGLLQAPPGTRLYERLKGEGRLVDEMSGDNADGSTNIIPRMGLDTLREGYRKLVDQIYAPAALLCPRDDFPARIPAAQDPPAPGAAICAGLVALDLPARYPRRRAGAVLEAVLLDAFPPPAPVPAGDYPIDLRIPFPAGGRVTYRIKTPQIIYLRQNNSSTIISAC